MSQTSDLDHLLQTTHMRQTAGGRSKDGNGKDQDAQEASCRAFGYLRGLQDRALAVRFCFRDGRSVVFPYSWLGPWEHNPAAGLLLKVTGDGATLLLIRGSNLDVELEGKGINLTDRGLQRHRIVWVKEMDEDELARAGEGEPTVDGIEMASFNAPDKLRDWVRQK